MSLLTLSSTSRTIWPADTFAAESTCSVSLPRLAGARTAASSVRLSGKSPPAHGCAARGRGVWGGESAEVRGSRAGARGRRAYEQRRRGCVVAQLPQC